MEGNSLNFFQETIETEEALRLFTGEPSDLVKSKVINHIDHHVKNFIAKSPFLMISTSDTNGLCDVSPRGDASGFVHILDEKHFVIPERPGNKRVDTLRNIIANPQVGLLFIIPGLEETLRINGKACVTKDEKILKEMSVNGKLPLFGIGVEVEECFIHCAKAFKRSKLWDVSSWEERDLLPSAAQILFDHAKLPQTTAENIKERLQNSYLNQLY
ncbi:pyridoxamine 5'-phosphate oxidase family protein [Anaerobacillus alkaliphilus]|uniref:Pyridoxamine 5'-phosphate oxidase family protein n=1 Tax=Anaerobacillus alkaliphilus TaxID=1548597 RepID=A0A4Q0VXW7_9BACI|nr:pyridoxamine 5'-phosphate oxidase family protein [Anaerobacillus alkaliphilus]RXJ04320.1 pyridoxamine 5'-phosphate oxidase family protein [Anaerobacillus alkaliphilus]